ncbi:MAG: FKBP-type peptidyl-prolyl cis-trans isomerase [Bacteroidia bacterium]|nr:FKBP-type peptidyl-prolyl cis-trans isomerase [Bacteroidia bacterium]
MFFIRNLFLFVIVALLACSSGNTSRKIINFDSLREPLINANKLSVKRESEEIDQYAKFKNWNMITTGTGARYMIYKHGEGGVAQSGQMARIAYKIYLLDGTLCYTSEKNGPKQFVIGGDNTETGLHEVITYLSVGDKAMIILPSHLAFGLAGDGNKIPPKSSVLYDIELLSLR